MYTRMSLQNIIPIVLLSTTIMTISGCAAKQPISTPQQYSYKPFSFPDSTIVLGLIKPITREEIINGFDFGFKATMPPLYDELIKYGYTDETIQDGSAVSVLNSVYWHNSVAGVRVKGGMHWALVPTELLSQLPAPGSSIPAAVGEIKITNGIGTLIRIRHKNKNDSSCDIKKDNTSFFKIPLNILSYLAGGPSGSASLSCDRLAEEGWVKKNYGFQEEYMWVKYPEGYEVPRE